MLQGNGGVEQHFNCGLRECFARRRTQRDGSRRSSCVPHSFAANFDDVALQRLLVLLRWLSNLKWAAKLMRRWRE